MRLKLNMETIALLFDQEHSFLGEIATCDGILARALLTAEGERRLGANISDWQTRGVPVLREIAANKQRPVFIHERVMVRDREFLNAVKAWSETHGVALIAISNEVLECWERITRLPLEPRERFSMVVTLRNAGREELQDWSNCLLEVNSAMELEAEKLEKTIKALRTRTAKALISAFAR